MNLASLVIPPWVKWAGIGLVAAGSFGAGFQVEAWRWSASELHAVKKGQKVAQKREEHANNESKGYEDKREKVRIEYRDREGAIHEIYRDIPAPAADCAAPPAVVGVLQQAIDSANAATG